MASGKHILVAKGGKLSIDGGHITNLIGTIQYLASHREQWHGTLMAIGQPAEERGAGASAMLEDGLSRLIASPARPSGHSGLKRTRPPIWIAWPVKVVDLRISMSPLLSAQRRGLHSLRVAITNGSDFLGNNF